MIKLTLEFKDAGEALDALFKLYGTPVPVGPAAGATVEGAFRNMVEDVPPAPSATAPAQTPEGTEKPKRGRPRKVKPENAAPATTEPLPQGENNVGAVSAPAPVAAAPTPVPSIDDAIGALDKVLSKHGMQAAEGILKDFGAARLRDLPEGKRADFITACYAKAGE